MRVLVRDCVVVLALLNAACADTNDDCDRAGCEALSQHARDTGEAGVAGVVAEESDVVGNGCQECGFGSAHIDFWATDETVDDFSELQRTRPPSASIDADRQYSLVLEPGAYVACVESYCANVTVHESHVTTLNVHLLFGPTQFVIRDPG